MNPDNNSNVWLEEAAAEVILCLIQKKTGKGWLGEVVAGVILLWINWWEGDCNNYIQQLHHRHRHRKS
jgi:hypothetical protein